MSGRAARDVEPELAALLEEVRSIAVIDQPLPWMSSRLAATQVQAGRGRKQARRFGVATVSVAFLLAMSSVAMANSAYPGHLLYGFDRALERIGIGDGGSPERIAEIEKLAAKGDFDSMEGLVDELLTTARSVADGINPETLTARTEMIVPIGPTAGAGNSVGDGETGPRPIPSNENPGFGPGKEIGNGASADSAPGHPSVSGNVTQQTPSEGASQAEPPANEGSQSGPAEPDGPPSESGQAGPDGSPDHSNAGGTTNTTPGPPEHSNAGGTTNTTPGPPEH